MGISPLRNLSDLARQDMVVNRFGLVRNVRITGGLANHDNLVFVRRSSERVYEWTLARRYHRGRRADREDGRRARCVRQSKCRPLRFAPRCYPRASGPPRRGV